MDRKGKLASRSILYGLVAGWLLLLPAVSQATTITFTPSATTANVGDLVTVDLNIEDVTDLYAFQLTIDFDPAVLQSTTTTEGPFLLPGGGTLFIPGAVDNVAGSISFLANTLLGPGPGVSGSGTLAHLGFTAFGPGTSPVAITFNVLNGDALLDSALAEITAETIGASVDVTTPVPEPASFFLVISGFSALAWAKKKRKAFWPRADIHSGRRL